MCSDWGTEAASNDHAGEYSAENRNSSMPGIAQSTLSPGVLQQDGTSGVVVGDISIDANMSTENLTNAISSETTSLLPQELDPFNHSSVGSMSDLESLFESSNGLIWNDLFDTTFDMSMPLIHDQLHDQPYSDPLSLLAHVAHQPQSHGLATQPVEGPLTPSQFYEKHALNATDALFDSQPPPYTTTQLDEEQVLQDAQYLLRHFRDKLVPQFGPVPMRCKSPWETLNWSNAVQTHAELTWLQGTDIKHANKANLFALLGCSAHMIARSSHPTTELDPVRGMQILEYASQHAKRHMQESLRLETSGDGKAKYKDQLMAIFSLIALAVSRT